MRWPIPAPPPPHLDRGHQGIDQNSPYYTLLFDVAWESEPFVLHEWWSDYALQRYGREDRRSVPEHKGGSKHGNAQSTKHDHTNISFFLVKKRTRIFEGSGRAV